MKIKLNQIVSSSNEFANIIVIPENIDGVYVDLSKDIHKITDIYEKNYSLFYEDKHMLQEQFQKWCKKKLKFFCFLD